MSYPSLADELQIWGFEKNIIVFTDGSTGFGIKIKPIDVSCMKDDDCELLDNSIKNFLNSLPDNTDVQFVQSITKHKEDEVLETKRLLVNDASVLQTTLCEERIDRFLKLNNDGVLPKQNLKVFVRIPLSQSLLEKKGIFSKSQLFPKITEDRFISEITKTQRLRESVIKSLSDIGANPIAMTEPEIFFDMYNFWNPSRKVKPKEDQPSYDPEDIRSSLVYEDAHIDLNSFKIGEYHYNESEVHVSGDRITAIQGMKAAGNLNLKLLFESGPRTKDNPWGIYILKETEVN